MNPFCLADATQETRQEVAQFGREMKEKGFKVSWHCETVHVRATEQKLQAYMNRESIKGKDFRRVTD